MGEVRVPAAAKWRAQTQRAVENFPISGQPIERELIAGLALIKGAGARVRAQRGLLDQAKADAIAAAADEVARGDWDAEFPIDVFQTGSGTSSNMNTNEVLASLAADRLGCVRAPERRRERPAVEQRPVPVGDPRRRHQGGRGRPRARARPPRRARSRRRPTEFATVVKSGRTHLMDATPVTLGQEFGGYAAQVRYGIERLHAVLPRVAELPLGGTAVGTGINAPAGFAGDVIALIASETGPAAHRGARPLRGAGRARRAGRAVRRAAHDRRRPEQDQQRHPLDGVGPAHRPDRAVPSRPAAGVVDHARQGEPGAVRGGLPGRRAGHRQRRRGRVGRRGRQLRTQRDAAGDRAQRPRIDPAASPTSRGCSPTGASPASRPTSSAAANTPSRRRRSSRR